MFRQTRLYRAALAVVLVALCAQTLITSMSNIRPPTLRDKRVCFLIAHPDDEAMFFAPTVLALTRPEAGNRVSMLSLSSGDAEGLGETRRRELVESALVLGLRGAEDVHVVNNPVDFPDSMTTLWSTDKISALLHERFAPNASNSRADPVIDVLITFDTRGVSSHPNHISLYHGARAFVSSLTGDSSDGRRSPVDLYTLTSVGLLRKYSGMLDVFATLGSAALSSGGRLMESGSGGSSVERPASLIFMHGLKAGGWATARRAMTTAHVSQMRWFRYGWITLSRYMYVNDLNLVEV